MTLAKRYTEVNDESGHYYVIPVNKIEDWRSFVDDYENFDVPDWALFVDGGALTFEKWKIEKL